MLLVVGMIFSNERSRTSVHVCIYIYIYIYILIYSYINILIHIYMREKDMCVDGVNSERPHEPSCPISTTVSQFMRPVVQK